MFKSLFKQYKNKERNVEEDDIFRQLKRRTLHTAVESDTLEELGLANPSQWDIFEHEKQPGLFVVKNGFTDEGQLRWIRRCVVDYPSPPNPNNLTPVGLLSSNEGWFEVCMSEPERRSRIFRKLRWVTLGYHHNWDTKVYSDNSRGEFPPDLARLSRIFARAVGGWSFSAEAAIVNYYYASSTISGHVDSSELNLNAPLLSFSFGDSALFLIGREDDLVSPVLIKSGDVVVMSGPSRLSCHGVPRILAAEERPWEKIVGDGGDSANALVLEYASAARININVRQVLFAGEKSLN